MTSKGILAFDIDGTLTHRTDWIDPKVVQTLQQFHEDGWQIALLTGRIFSFAWKILQYFQLPYLLAVQNGADILEMPSKNPLKRSYVSADVLPQIDEAYQGQEEDYIIYAGIDHGDFCYYRPERFSKKNLEYLKLLESLGAAAWKPSDFAFEKGTAFPLIKCFGTQKAMEKVHQKLETKAGIEVSWIRDPIDPRLYLNLVTHPNTHKGAVVHFLREHFQASLIIAAGDERNDLKMLKEADLAIVVETAPAVVREVADIFAKPANELGIIEALKEAISRAKR